MMDDVDVLADNDVNIMSDAVVTSITAVNPSTISGAYSDDLSASSSSFVSPPIPTAVASVSVTTPSITDATVKSTSSPSNTFISSPVASKTSVSSVSPSNQAADNVYGSPSNLNLLSTYYMEDQIVSNENVHHSSLDENSSSINKNMNAKRAFDDTYNNNSNNGDSASVGNHEDHRANKINTHSYPHLNHNGNISTHYPGSQHQQQLHHHQHHQYNQYQHQQYHHYPYQPANAVFQNHFREISPHQSDDKYVSPPVVELSTSEGIILLSQKEMEIFPNLFAMISQDEPDKNESNNNNRPNNFSTEADESIYSQASDFDVNDTRANVSINTTNPNAVNDKPSEQSRYQTLNNNVGVDGFIIALLFRRSGLPNDTLKEIWKLACGGVSKKRLLFSEFCIACKLIAHVQQKIVAFLNNGGDIEMIHCIKVLSLNPILSLEKSSYLPDFDISPQAPDFCVNTSPLFQKDQMDVQIPSTRDIGSNFSSFTLYKIVTKCLLPDIFPVSDMVCERRYSDICWLHIRLRNLFPAIAIPPPPPKRLVKNFDPDLIEERRAGLQQYLSYIARHPKLARTLEVFVFLYGSIRSLKALKLIIEKKEGGSGAFQKMVNPTLVPTLSASMSSHGLTAPINQSLSNNLSIASIKKESSCEQICENDETKSESIAANSSNGVKNDSDVISAEEQKTLIATTFDKIAGFISPFTSRILGRGMNAEETRDDFLSRIYESFIGGEKMSVDLIQSSDDEYASDAERRGICCPINEAKSYVENLATYQNRIATVIALSKKMLIVEKEKTDHLAGLSACLSAIDELKYPSPITSKSVAVNGHSQISINHNENQISFIKEVSIELKEIVIESSTRINHEQNILYTELKFRNDCIVGIRQIFRNHRDQLTHASYLSKRLIELENAQTDDKIIEREKIKDDLFHAEIAISKLKEGIKLECQSFANDSCDFHCTCAFRFSFFRKCEAKFDKSKHKKLEKSYQMDYIKKQQQQQQRHRHHHNYHHNQYEETEQRNIIQGTDDSSSLLYLR